MDPSFTKKFQIIFVKQAGSALANRVTDQEFLWHREVKTNCPEVDEHFQLDLDILNVKTAIEQLEFLQLKGKKMRREFLIYKKFKF